MTELIRDVDPGMLPPRTRLISSHVGTAMERGWKPIELAQSLGVAPSFLSELIAELRTVLGFVNGVFPTHSEDEYRALLESVAEQGVVCAIVVDEHGVIDGHARLRACKELAHIVDLATVYPSWQDIHAEVVDARATLSQARETLALAGATLDDDRLAPNEKERLLQLVDEARACKEGQEALLAAVKDDHGEEVFEDVAYLAGIGDVLIAEAQMRRWDEPPVDRHTNLSKPERRALAVTLNAHRRHLNRGDLRLLIEVEIMRDGGRSNAAIARLIGCTKQYVGQVRTQVAEDELTFGADPAREGGKPVSPLWRPVIELDCPHCQGHLALERAGRDFRLELTA